MATAPLTTPVTIVAGQALSSPVSIPGVVVGFSLPMNWTTAPVSFQTSIQGGPFVEMLREGNNYVVNSSVPSYNAENKNYWGGVDSLIIRSGVVDDTIPQNATVIILVSYEPFS